MQSVTPLFQRISTKDHRYVYDPATNMLSRVSQYVYDNLEQLSRMSHDDVLQLCRDKDNIKADLLTSAWEQLQEQRKHADFLPCELPRVGFEMSRSDIESAVLHNCGTFVLEVTNQCNLRCKYCVFSGGYPNNRRHGTRDMDPDTAIKSIDLIDELSSGLPADKSTVGIGFGGGEPMLNWPLVQKMSEYIREKNWSYRTVSLNMTTNATLLTKDILDFLIDQQFSITISLDGPREVHDRYRRTVGGKDGSFDRVMNALDLIRTVNHEYFISNVAFSTVLSHPIDWLALDRFFRIEMGLDRGKVLLASVREGNEIYSSALDVLTGTSEGWEEIEGRFLDAATEGVLFGQFERGSQQDLLQKKGNTCITFHLLVAPMIKFHMRHTFMGWPEGKLLPSGACLPPTKRLLIDCHGDLYPCDRMDFNDFTKIGDVDRGIDIDKLIDWLRDYYELTKDECSRCWAVRLCNQCFINAVAKNSFDREARLRGCDSIREELMLKFQTYCGILERNSNALDDHGEVSFS